jgi:decaprenyl-phosphate phosphoribosyltransferase
MNYLKLLRIKDWVKNLFILLPLLFEGKANLVNLVDSFDVLLIFSLAASFTYIFNDLIDLEHDKKNPYKNLRPLASGQVSINKAKFFLFIIFIAIILLNYLFFNPNIIFCIVTYLFLNFTYSIYFKKIFILNIVFLLSFYYLRILIGSLYFHIPLTPWITLLTLSSLIILIFGKKYKDFNYNKKKDFFFNKIKYINLIIFFSFIQFVIYLFYSLSEKAILKYGNLFPYSSLLVLIGNIRYIYIIIYKKVSSDQVKIFFEDKLLILILFTYFLLISYALYF